MTTWKEVRDIICKGAGGYQAMADALNESVREVEDLRARNESLIYILRKIEWQGEGGHWEESGCPACFSTRQLGHDEDCIIKQALAH